MTTATTMTLDEAITEMAKREANAGATMRRVSIGRMLDMLLRWQAVDGQEKRKAEAIIAALAV